MKRHDSDDSPVAAILQRCYLSGKALYKKKKLLLLIANGFENVYTLTNARFHFPMIKAFPQKINASKYHEISFAGHNISVINCCINERFN